jgi:hypothetical protein
MSIRAFGERGSAAIIVSRLLPPHLINLITDPQEREPLSLPHLHSWVAHHINRIIGEFEASLRSEPLIPAGVALDHVPQPAPK